VDHPRLFFYASFILIAFGGGGCAAVAFTMVSLGLFALCHVQSPWVMLLFLFLFPAGLGATRP